jgi:hypothetical protein
MQKPLLRLFLLICLPVYLSAQSGSVADDGVEELKLEMDTLIYCPYRVTEVCRTVKPTINVSTVAKAARNEGLTYYYFITGGKVIGEGASVVWDFSKEKTGKYSITVGVGKDSVIYGKPVTKTIDFAFCYACDTCECPVLRVSGPTNPIKAGDAAIVTAEVTRGTQQSVRYNWTLSDGRTAMKPTKATIEIGQSTAQIVVRTDKSMKGQKVIATVELGGVCATCGHTASFMIEIDGK